MRNFNLIATRTLPTNGTPTSSISFSRIASESSFLNRNSVNDLCLVADEICRFPFVERFSVSTTPRTGPLTPSKCWCRMLSQLTKKVLDPLVLSAGKSPLIGCICCLTLSLLQIPTSVVIWHSLEP